MQRPIRMEGEVTDDPERLRLAEERDKGIPWKKWGPYLSERQWGTVREDYSATGDAWSYLTHDQARSRAYHWGEDGLAGFCDDAQHLCFALALWNGKDPIIKERLFGLSNCEGNHGEDVKEYCFYLDGTPTHSYMRYLYKYPQDAFPYEDLVSTNRRRSKLEPEYELLDTGVFDNHRYFDVFVEYAKATPDNILIKITIVNRGADAASLHVLPTLWFRNTWSWEQGAVKPRLRQGEARLGCRTITAAHAVLGDRFLFCEGSPELLFTENETNRARLLGEANPTPFVKDAFNEYLTKGARDAVNPALIGTKAAAHYLVRVPAGGSQVVRLRLTDSALAGRSGPFGTAFEKTFGQRRTEADAFYRVLLPDDVGEDTKQVFRQALAGMLWTKQYFYYDVDAWLREHGCDAQRHPTSLVRNHEWFHMLNADIISMPDKWEYPWYAAWDLAFHAVPLCLVDPEFAKGQLELILREDYLHPNGQLPACEWNFSDVNPPVHAWAVHAVYIADARQRGGRGDIEFLKLVFQKLLMNFTWWMNRKDPQGNTVFGGGSLGLDNIGVLDRSAPLPDGGTLDQSDGTAWMAFYAAQMLRISLELARYEPVYEEMALKFIEHFLWIASAMDWVGEQNDQLWDEDDGFFYDVLRVPDGQAVRLKARSMIGLLAIAATTVIPAEVVDRFPALVAKARNFFEKRPEAANYLVSPAQPGVNGRRLIAVLGETKLRRILARMLDESEFLSDYGIRSLSKAHKDDPCEFTVGPHAYRVAYEPAESTNGMFGGNTNWRGPIWLPVNVLIIRGLLTHYLYYGDGFKVECPSGSGQIKTLYEVAVELCRRLTAIFVRDADGRRPVNGSAETFQSDSHWRDHLLFYQYFDGDSGRGLGASHQTGWTGLIASLISFVATTSADEFLRSGDNAGDEPIFLDPKRRRRSVG